MHNNDLMGVAGASSPNVDEAARITANYQMGNDDRDINHQSYLTRENDSSPKVNFEKKFRELEKKHRVLLEKNTSTDTRHKDRQKGISCTYCHIRGHIAEDCNRRKKEIESKQKSGKQKQKSKEKAPIMYAASNLLSLPLSS
jgi:hypothetical protein